MVLKNPVAIIGFPMLVFSVHALALIIGLYKQVQHFDSIMHFSGGLVAALSIYGMIQHARDRGWVRLDDRLVARLLIIGLVAMVTVAWEVFEYLLDTYAGTFWQPSIFDTVKDQVLGVLGACVAVLRLRF